MHRTAILLFLGLSALAWAQPVRPGETRVVIRAVSHGAKVLGDHVGGARITVREAASGQILAQGVQQGGSGDTARIMKHAHQPGESVYDGEGAARFVAELDLEQPTLVEIMAEGPLKPPHATRTVFRTMLLVPGQHIEGDGVLLEIYGYIVEIEQPQTEAGAEHPVLVRAKLTMT